MSGALRVLIADDEALAREVLRGICSVDPRVEVIAEAADGPATLARLSQGGIDLILLDISMPGLSGVGVAERARECEPRPAIIFVTAHHEYATAAYDLDVCDYILKPVVGERLGRALDRVVASRHRTTSPDRPSGLWVPHLGSLVRVETHRIIRIEAERDYVRIHVGERAYMLRSTMQDLEDRLDPCAFVRIHRSTIVAIQAVEALRHLGSGAWGVVLGTGEIRPVGRSLLSSVRRALGVPQGG